MLAPRLARRAYSAAVAGARPGGWSRWPARNVRRRLGLLRARSAFCSGATLSTEVVRWFGVLGVPLTDVYALWEAAAPADEAATGEFAHEPAGAGAAERELRACCAIADALVFEPAPRRRVALLRPERDYLLAWAQEQQLPFTGFEDLLRLPAVDELLRSQVERANARLPTGERVAAFRLVTDGEEPEDDAVSATLGLRRSVIGQRHAALLAEVAGAPPRARRERSFTLLPESRPACA